MKVSICENPACGRSFVYYGRKVRRVCPDCRADREAEAKRKWKLKPLARHKAGPLFKEDRADGQMSHREIARVMGVSEATVRQAEQAALKKIRSSPAIMETLSSFLGAGLAAEMPWAEPLERLLIYQLHVRELWDTHALAQRAGMTEDAEWCAAQIRTYQQKIADIIA